MAQIPNRLDPTTSYDDNLALLNDNADKTIQDMADLGAKFSTGASGTCTIAAGGWFAFTVGMQDSIGIYVKDQFPINPRCDVWVDTQDDAHYLPDGASVTTAQGKTIVVVRTSKTSRNNFTTEKATYFVTIHNLDSSPHTYYIACDNYYQQSSNQGGVYR